MTTKDRRFGGMFFYEDVHKFKGLWIHVAVSLMRHIGNQAHQHLFKSGHAFYVNGHSLFVLGSPSRSDYSQSPIGLP